MTADLDRPRRGGLWHHPEFRRLWIGESISQFGSTISQLALPLVAILIVQASTFEVGLLVTCEMAAFLLVGLPAGAWVDRMRFRTVLIVNDVLRALALASVPLAQWLGVLGMGQLYVVALLTGVCTVFFDVAYQSFLPQLVEREQLVEANAKLQASESVIPDQWPERRRPADPGADRAVRGAARRAQLSLVGVLGGRYQDPAGQARPPARPQPAPRDRRGAALRAGQPAAARDRAVHRHGEPVQLDGGRGVVRAAGPRAGACPPA